MRVTSGASRERTRLRGARGRRFGAVAPPEDLVAEVAANQLHFFDKVMFRPAAVDLRESFPPVYDQGNTNSCTACVAAAIVDYLRAKQGLPALAPSRSFIYFFDRQLCRIQKPDGGGSVVAALQAAAKFGYCSEPTWPFEPKQFVQHPSENAMAEATQHRAGSPAVIGSLEDIRDTLARRIPVGIALLVYNSFYQADHNGGTVPMPGPREGFTRHAGVLVGYREDGYLMMRNSWGVRNPDGGENGDRGHYYLPPAYFEGKLVYERYAIKDVVDS